MSARRREVDLQSASVTLWDRIRGVGRDGARAREAAELEESGDLRGAADAYLAAELGDEAARVLMMRADVERSLDKRVALLEHAGRVAVEEKVRAKARGRRAKLAFEIVKASGAAARSEILAAAAELEEAGESLTAAEAYHLVGDREGEVRALTAAGAIDELEERLGEDAASTHRENRISLSRSRVTDLDSGGERLRALAEARAALALTSDDRLDALARTIRLRLARGPTVPLTWASATKTVAFGEAVTVGRGEATIVVATRAVSRVHLRVRRLGDAIVVEDAGTRNGTLLHGARLGAAIPIGEGVSLELGGSVPCEVRPSGEGVEIVIAGGCWFAPLGPLVVGRWRVGLVASAAATPGALTDPATLVLSSTNEAPAYLGELEAARTIDLCYGDLVSETRGGPAVLGVGAPETP